MTLFRHKNGKLYTLEMVRRRLWLESPKLVATPYRHTLQIKKANVKDFVPVAICSDVKQ
jgi:hypothetical protein